MKKLRICFTSDVHGYFNPVNYGTGKPEQSGLLSLASAFHKDENTLILDGGDLLQGSPMAMYQSSRFAKRAGAVRKESGDGDAAIFAQVMNLCGYDYVTIGNHDFNYGRAYLLSYLQKLDAECVCCNVRDALGQLPVTGHVIRVVENGLRVGIIGACTDFVNIWEKAEHLEHLQVQDVREKLESEVAAIRDQVDILIGIYHGGFETDLESGMRLTSSRENIGWEICQDLPFDLLCTGHQHMPVEGQLINGTWVVQTTHNGKQFAEIVLEWEDGCCDWSSRLVPAKEPALIAGTRLLRDLEAQVQTWLDTPVGHFTQPLLPGPKAEMAYYGSPIADLFNRVQLAYSGAQISCTSLGNDIKGFPSDVTARDIVSTYVYQNTLVVLRVTGQVLRQALERCGEYFDYVEGVLCVSERFLKPKVEHYNYDFFMGIDYGFDVAQPPGRRLTHLLYRGQPVEDDLEYTLCMNNYRASGTGGYECYIGCPVVKDIQMDMVEMIIGYLSEGIE